MVEWVSWLIAPGLEWCWVISNMGGFMSIPSRDSHDSKAHCTIHNRHCIVLKTPVVAVKCTLVHSAPVPRALPIPPSTRALCLLFFVVFWRKQMQLWKKTNSWPTHQVLRKWTSRLRCHLFSHPIVLLKPTWGVSSLFSTNSSVRRIYPWAPNSIYSPTLNP